jgi:hypothetical protein
VCPRARVLSGDGMGRGHWRGRLPCQSPACLPENEGATVPLKVPTAIKCDRAVHKPSSLTMLAAIRLGSSRVSSFAARRATARDKIKGAECGRWVAP